MRLRITLLCRGASSSCGAPPAEHHFVCHAASFLITGRLISPANESSKVYCVSFCDGSVGDIASCTRADRNRDAPEITVGDEIGY